MIALRTDEPGRSGVLSEITEFAHGCLAAGSRERSGYCGRRWFRRRVVLGQQRVTYRLGIAGWLPRFAPRLAV